MGINTQELYRAAEKLSKRKKALTFEEPPLGKATPHWFMRLDIIKSRIEKCGWEWFDRQAIVIMFDVSPATAVRILKRFYARKMGRARVMSREHLLDAVKSILADPKYQAERSRDEDRWQKISALRPEPTRNLIEYGEQVESKYDPKALAALPNNILFEPGRCIIQAKTADELLQQLVILAAQCEVGLDGYDAINEALQ